MLKGGGKNVSCELHIQQAGDNDQDREGILYHQGKRERITIDCGLCLAVHVDLTTVWQWTSP
jgi:hypothetical protein